jgi:hypothetical protein
MRQPHGLFAFEPPYVESGSKDLLRTPMYCVSIHDMPPYMVILGLDWPKRSSIVPTPIFWTRNAT